MENKENIMYITPFINDLDNNSSGIVKKIKSQIQVFKNWGFNVSYVHSNKREGSGIVEKLKGQFLANYRINRYLRSLLKNKKYTLIYIRYENPDFFFLRFIQLLARSGSKIILEIPTFPYDKERLSRINTSNHFNLKSFLINIYFYINDKVIRKYLKSYVDYIFTYSDDQYIFGIRTISSSNGINVKDVPVTRSSFDGQVLNLIGVATLNWEHGYDRVIKGIYEYKKSNRRIDVKFHIVGDGPEKKKLEDLTSKLSLENEVFFYGSKSGKDLDKIFDISNIGVSSLGRHRQGIYKMTDLKSREYCSRGLPFICSVIDKDFIDQNFVFNFEPNESSINIILLINKYLNFQRNNKDAKEKIRNFAEKNLNWDKKLEGILKVLEN